MWRGYNRGKRKGCVLLLAVYGCTPLSGEYREIRVFFLFAGTGRQTGGREVCGGKEGIGMYEREQAHPINSLRGKENKNNFFVLLLRSACFRNDPCFILGVLAIFAGQPLQEKTLQCFTVAHCIT